MVNKLYVVKDEKIGFNQQLLSAENDQVALRSFAIGVNTPGSLMNTNPEDFNLYQVGTFNSESGIIEPMSAPLLIGKAVEYKKQPKNAVPYPTESEVK